MREIKFRAWDKEEEEMIDNESLYGNEICPIANNYGAFEEYVFMQYTGLTDKNGVEIYEGDILKCFGDIAKVVWDNRDALYRYVYNSGGERYMQILGTHSYEHFEVIGNIYENTELLESNE